MATALVGVLGYACLLVVRGGVPAEMFDRLGFGMTASGIVEAAGRAHVLLVYGVLGAVLIGWMALLLAVVLGPLRRREPWACRSQLPSAYRWSPCACVGPPRTFRHNRRPGITSLRTR